MKRSAGETGAGDKGTVQEGDDLPPGAKITGAEGGKAGAVGDAVLHRPGELGQVMIGPQVGEGKIGAVMIIA